MTALSPMMQPVPSLKDELDTYKREVDRVRQAVARLHQAVRAGNLSAPQAALDEEALHIALETSSCCQAVVSHRKRTTLAPHFGHLFRRTFVAVFFDLP
jgi:hypothetical protein